MKTKNFVFQAALSVSMSLLGMSTLAHAQASDGYISDYSYQVTNVSSMAEAQAIMNTETHDTRNASICANRADVWTYIMRKDMNVQTGKVFIHFTKDGQADENKQWAYHVAPYIIVNGQETVLDSAFAVFGNKPVALSQWTKYFGKSDHCVVLDPLHNPAHMKLEQNNLPNDRVTPLTYRSGGARQYPSSEGICYIRKMPMYYVYPINVYGADLAKAGHAEFSSFLKTDFDQDDVLAACRQALTLGARISQSCGSYLGLSSND